MNRVKKECCKGMIILRFVSPGLVDRRDNKSACTKWLTQSMQRTKSDKNDALIRLLQKRALQSYARDIRLTTLSVLSKHIGENNINAKTNFY